MERAGSGDVCRRASLPDRRRPFDDIQHGLRRNAVCVHIRVQITAKLLVVRILDILAEQVLRQDSANHTRIRSRHFFTVNEIEFAGNQRLIAVRIPLFHFDPCLGNPAPGRIFDIALRVFERLRSGQCLKMASIFIRPAAPAMNRIMPPIPHFAGVGIPVTDAIVENVRIRA